VGGSNLPEDMFLFVAPFLFNLFPPFIAALVLAAVFYEHDEHPLYYFDFEGREY
jgi:hypothetical protein